MRQDISSSIAKEQKTFIIVQSIVLLAILILAITAGTHNQTPKKEAICGDGVLDRKENSETCCLDAGCGEGLTCLKNDDDTYSCKERIKVETSEFKEYINLGKTLMKKAYSYEDEAQDIQLTKQLMKTSIDNLKEEGFPMQVEEENFEFITDHLTTIETIGRYNQQIETISATPNFLQVYVLEEGNATDIEEELILVQNITQESMNVILAFEEQINALSTEAQEQLQTTLFIDPETILIEYDILLEGFNETNIKTTELLETI